MRQVKRSRNELSVQRAVRAVRSTMEGLESRVHLSSGWGNYVGGLQSEDTTVAKVVAKGDAIYVVGTTTSRGWFQNSLLNGGRTDNSGARDGFIAKYTADGTLVWGRFFGGELDDTLSDAAIDDAGNVYVVGTAYGYSDDRNYAFGPGGVVSGYAGGASDAVVGKIDPNGQIQWIGFVGGQGADTGAAIAVKGENVFVVGDTQSSEGWVKSDAENPYGQTWKSAGTAGFVASLATADGKPAWSDYISGTGTDHALGIAAAGGNLFIVGSTTSSDLRGAPSFYGARQWSGSEADGYVLHLDPIDGSRMGFTYLSANGAGPAAATAVALDPWANPVVVGNTTGELQWNTVPTVTVTSPDNVFVAKFDNSLVLADWGVTVDGDAAMDASAIVVNDDASVVIGGATSATSFHLTKVDGAGAAIFPANAPQGGTDGYLLRLDQQGGPVALKYFGGEGTDRIGGIAVNSDGLVVSGTTDSTTFPDIKSTTPQGVSVPGTLQGASDAFVLSIGALDTTAPTVQYQPDSGTTTLAGEAQFTIIYKDELTPIKDYPQSLTLGSGKSALIATAAAPITTGNTTTVTYTIPLPLKGWKHGQKLPIVIDPGMVHDIAGNSNDRPMQTTLTMDAKAPTASIATTKVNSSPRMIAVTYDGTTAEKIPAGSTYAMRKIPTELYLTNPKTGVSVRATRQDLLTQTKGAKTTVYYQLGNSAAAGTYTLKILRGSFSDAAGLASDRDYSKQVTLKVPAARPVTTSAAPLYGPAVQAASVFSTQSLLVNDTSLLA